MSGDGKRRERTKELFLAAIRLELGERASFLEEACAEDAQLRLEVEELLLGHASSDDFLATPILGEERSLMQLLGEEVDRVDIPDHIGDYQVLERLGAGGMGIVYLARQKQPRREVALKVIRPGMASARALRRFEYEAELLGRLSHEGIARIHEAGTASSAGELVPFFAMERVVGAPLLEHAEREGLDERQRMALVAEIAEAVHHAHQKGVVHRDLKPANILVTPEGRPKVLDFGVARATDGDLQAARPETAVDQLVGTLAYMSPEQACGDSSRLDARADVYALGVIAFQLLTGTLPHDLSGKTVPEAVLCLTEEPPTKLSSLLPRVHADLELVLSVALEPDPARRYPSAHALAADLRRWLAHEPVAARPASPGYLLARFLRRNRLGVAAALVATLGLAGWAHGLWRARTVEHEAELARQSAESEAQGAREMFEIWLATFDGQDPGAGVTTPMLERLEETVAGIEARYQDRPELAGELHLTIGYTFLRFGEYERALERMERGVAAYTRAFGANHGETLNARANQANAHIGLRDAKSAVALLRDVHARALEHLGRDHRVTRFALGRLGSVLAMAGELAEAREITEEALAGLAASLGEDDLQTLSMRYTLASLLRAEGSTDEAMEQLAAVLAAFEDEALFARQPGLKWGAMGELARLLVSQERFQEALELNEQLVEEQSEQYGSREHPTVLLAREQVATLEAELGELESAIAELRELRQVSLTLRGEEHTDSMRLAHTLARFLLRTGADDGEAEELLKRIIELGDRPEGPARADAVEYHLLLGRHLLRKERLTEARPHFERALEVAELVFPGGSRVHERAREHLELVDEALRSKRY